jgi:hypothetical protein
LDFKQIGIDLLDPSTHNKRNEISGLNDSYQWNKRQFAGTANCMVLQDPTIYCLFAAYHARLNPNHLFPERLYPMHYEAKARLSSDKKDTVAHVDAQPWNLLRKVERGEEVAHLIQAWVPLYDVTDDILEVEFAVGGHKTWKEDYSALPKEKWPSLNLI